jgi:small-conductance mechanosensitive channel
MHAGGVAGQVEGTVASLGLLYTTLANGEDRILVPNNVVLSGAVVRRCASPRGSTFARDSTPRSSRARSSTASSAA